MEFLRQCAARLDAGELAADVLDDMRLRYTTLRCLNVKTCLVRGMCATQTDNVRALRLTRAEGRACKRLAAQARLEKNRLRTRVEGRAILACCRGLADELHAPEDVTLLHVAALMLLTGRRTCEVLSGASSFAVKGAHTVRFEGQAKKRGKGEAYMVPVLHDAEALVRGLHLALLWSSVRPGQDQTLNQATSSKYQSSLGRCVAAHPLLREVGRVHALRGLYACMAYRLFEWDGDYSEAYVVMHILGHNNLMETLVYTPFNLGSFEAEPKLGRHALAIPADESAAQGAR